VAGRISVAQGVPRSRRYHRSVRPPADQLSLELEPGAPRLPGDLRPMLAKPAEEPFDDPNWLFEPSWEGLRALAHVENGRLRLVDARGRDVTSRFPDLLGLIDAVVAAPCVLDGEIVIPESQGMPDPDALQQRLRPLDEGHAKPHRGHATYLVDDLLVHDGRSLLREPLERRRALLVTALKPGDRLVLVPAVAGEGSTLFDAVEAQGLPGMLARRRDSPYLPGMRSDLWRRIRTARRFEAVVGGYSPLPDGRVALLLGAWEGTAAEDGRFVAVAAVDARAGSAMAAGLERALRGLEDAVTPFRRGARADYRWVRPELVVTVEHRGWLDGRLVEPRVVAIRDELEARGCRLPPATEPGNDADEEVRRPVLALLQRLPLGDD
jgi:bifunctional non-homologous end joining protein LigD